MATARSWTRSAHADGPYQARGEDIPALNRVFSEAFTDRYRRDGMVGVRVPQLNPAIWRYAIEDAGKGAMLWRDERGEIAAFNIAHRSGIEGWMGPLAVRADRQAGGVGKEMVREGIEHLKRSGAKIIGLETMPRTMDNIGFYSSIGFIPGRLTVTLTLDAVANESPVTLFGRLPARDRDDVLEECRLLVDSLIAGYNFTREIELTDDL
jgi:GNAT superfamily N-acetyltransferase